MKKILFFLTFSVFILVCIEVNADEIGPDNPDYYDYSEINNVLRDYDNLDFGTMVKELSQGEDGDFLKRLGDRLIAYVLNEINAEKAVILQLFLIGICAALVSGIAKAFFNNTTSEVSFYLVLMLLMCTLAAGYKIAARIVVSTLEVIIELMNAIVPVYVVSVGFVAGSNSACSLYQIIAIVIAFVEKFMRDFILPLVYVFTIANFVNNMSEENLLSKMCELIKTIISWVLRAIMSLIIGINVIRGILSPVIDSIKATALGRTASMLPGVGRIISSVSDIVLGCGTLIKNSIGVAAAITIMVISIIPVLKILLSSIGYKLVGAVLEPVSDKRIVNAVNGMYEEVHGLEEELKVAYNDVDFCLKVREKKYKVVYNPYAVLYHYESKSRGQDDTPEKKERFRRESRYMVDKWAEYYDKGDPFYNVNLTLLSTECDLRGKYEYKVLDRIRMD